MRYGDPQIPPPPIRVEWDYRYFSPEEVEHASFVGENLDALPQQVHRFRAALFLFQNCQHNDFGLIQQGGDEANVLAGQDLLRQWRHMAARDGILSTYNVAELLQAIDTATAKSPLLKEHRDLKAAGEARAIMKEAFPNLQSVRHAAAHTALFKSTKKQKDAHTAEGPIEGVPWLAMPAGGKIFIADTLIGATFTCTQRGKVVSYDLTPDSFAAIRLVSYLTWKSFEPIEAELRRRHAERFPGRG